VEQEKETSRMVEQSTNNEYIEIKGIKSYIVTPQEQRQIDDQMWVTWMIFVICGFCFVNYIFGFLKNLGATK